MCLLCVLINRLPHERIDCWLNPMNNGRMDESSPILVAMRRDEIHSAGMADGICSLGFDAGSQFVPQCMCHANIDSRAGTVNVRASGGHCPWVIAVTISR